MTKTTNSNDNPYRLIGDADPIGISRGLNIYYSLMLFALPRHVIGSNSPDMSNALVWVWPVNLIDAVDLDVGSHVSCSGGLVWDLLWQFPLGIGDVLRFGAGTPTALFVVAVWVCIWMSHRNGKMALRAKRRPARSGSRTPSEFNVSYNANILSKLLLEPMQLFLCLVVLLFCTFKLRLKFAYLNLKVAYLIRRVDKLLLRKNKLLAKDASDRQVLHSI